MYFCPLIQTAQFGTNQKLKKGFLCHAQSLPGASQHAATDLPMMRGSGLHFKIQEEQSLHTINTDILEGKLNLRDCYVILITAPLTHYTF